MLGSADLSGLKQSKQHWAIADRSGRATDWATLALAQGVLHKKAKGGDGRQAVEVDMGRCIAPASCLRRRGRAGQAGRQGL